VSVIEYLFSVQQQNQHKNDKFWRFADRASQYIYLSNNQLDAQNLFYNKFISCLYLLRAPVLIIRRSKLHYTASGIITPIGGRLVHETTTCRCDDTRGCVIQFWPPVDKHMCSKQVEAWNKLIVKQKCCASSWLITEINKNDSSIAIQFSVYCLHNVVMQSHTSIPIYLGHFLHHDNSMFGCVPVPYSFLGHGKLLGVFRK